MMVSIMVSCQPFVPPTHGWYNPNMNPCLPYSFPTSSAFN